MSNDLHGAVCLNACYICVFCVAVVAVVECCMHRRGDNEIGRERWIERAWWTDDNGNGNVQRKLAHLSLCIASHVHKFSVHTSHAFIHVLLFLRACIQQCSVFAVFVRYFYLSIYRIVQRCAHIIKSLFGNYKITKTAFLLLLFRIHARVFGDGRHKMKSSMRLYSGWVHRIPIDCIEHKRHGHKELVFPFYPCLTFHFSILQSKHSLKWRLAAWLPAIVPQTKN